MLTALPGSFLTFLLLWPAEAAGGFLELVAVNFDHPEWAEHLCQVGRLITGQNTNTQSGETVEGKRLDSLRERKNVFLTVTLK